MANEPGAAVRTIFAQLIDRIKERTPVGSNDKPIGRKVYSQLVLGMPIDRRDYMNPWSPVGGASFREVAAGTADAPAVADPQVLQAMQAAWKTSLLCKTMLAVTKDGQYREYPIGRHLDFAYEAILKGMTPAQIPEESEDIKKRRLNAQKVLFKLDADGNPDVFEKAKIYERYLENADALAEAKAILATENVMAMADPAKAQAWPVTSAKFNRAVKKARDNLISEGAEQVEKALAVIDSIGMPVQATLISKAKEEWDNWNIGLTGVVPGNSPYSLIMPTNWCDPDNHDGWETLTVDQSSYKHWDSDSSNTDTATSWAQNSESSGGSAGVMFGFAAFAASGDDASSNSSWQSSSNTTFRSAFKNSATNLKIELEYGLCTIIRPWLVSDLFYLKDWFLTNGRKQSISDGTIDGQANSDENLLPMIPQQFLVVRNVKISTKTWGEDGDSFRNIYSSGQGSDTSSSSTVEGGGGISLGFISFGGTASHSEAHASGQTTSFNANNGNAYYGTTFDGETLHIPGAQIVAFLSDIVPACPGIDDPSLQV
jgi:hypothetical protein